MESSLTPTDDPEKFRKKLECPICHGRIFSFVRVATKADVVAPIVSGKVRGSNLQCKRCDGKADELFVVPMSDDLICWACKLDLAELNELELKYRSIMAY
jgi:C4-type Zn-finger protein